MPVLESAERLTSFLSFHEEDILAKLAMNAGTLDFAAANLPGPPAVSGSGVPSGSSGSPSPGLGGRLGLQSYAKSIAGATFAGWKLNASVGNVSLQVGGASVYVPTAHLLGKVNLTEVVLVVGIVPDGAPGWADSRDAAGRPVTPHFLMNANVFTPQSRRVDVSGLDQSLVLGMPVNHTENNTMSPPPACGFLDEGRNLWVDLPGELTWGRLTCYSTHLTLFGALLKGFLDALMCSQLHLFSRESFQRLSRGSWYATRVAGIFWGFVAVLGTLMLSAVFMDYRRLKRGFSFTDEDFLVPLTDYQGDTDFQETRSRHAGCMATAGDCVAGCKDQCLDTGTCRDIADELISSKLAWFSKVRMLLEKCCSGGSAGQGAGGSGQESKAMVLMHSVVDAMVMSSARSQVSASLGISSDTVDFVGTDEAFADIVLKADAKELPACWAVNLSVWRELHRTVIAETDRHWHQHGPWALPVAVVRLLVVGNPIVSLFLADCFISAKLRMLLYTAEISGTWMVSGLFMVSTGGASSALNGAECTEAANIWEELGRIIAVSTFSLILGALPVSLLGSLHSREFKKCDYKGCPEWKEQMKHWRQRDKMLVIAASAYIAFCFMTMMLFLANVAEEDQPEWGVSGAISLGEEVVLLPAFMALVTPMATVLLLLLVSAFAGKHHKELLAHRKEQLELSGNWAQRTEVEPAPPKEVNEGGGAEGNCRVSV